MQLGLHNILPIPLKDRLQARPSAIWMQDLSWAQGEHIFVQAPSGTGKTTLIHLLYGLRADYDGRVSWNGNLMKDREEIARHRTRHLSIVFQDLRLFPNLTAWENLEVKRTLTNTVDEAQVADWMKRLGIAQKRDAQGSTLSYGEQQRLAIIRALVQPFQWLLMDEPFSHLDKANTAKAAALISEVVGQRGASFLLADLDENQHLPYTKTLFL